MFDSAIMLPLAGIAALFVGPLFYALAGKRQTAMSALDGFVLTSVGGLVVLFVLPAAMAASGGLAIVAALVGMTLPLVMERLLGIASRTAHTIMLISAMVGLFVHTMLDGVALFEGGHSDDAGALAMAVLLHRLPVSLAIWSIVSPQYGKRGALLTLGGAAVGTALGAVIGHHLHDLGTGSGFQLFQALVAGSLLHVVVHKHDHATGSKWPEFVGGVLGVVVLLVVPELMATDDHGHDHGGSALHRMLEIALEAAPALVLGFGLAALLGIRFRRPPSRWLTTGPAPVQAAKGMLVGLPLPICSCGVVPVYHGLIRAGVPATAAMAFLVATPEIGIESLILSVPMLGWDMTLWRLGVAAFIALAAGTLVGRLVPRPQFSLPDASPLVSGDTLGAFAKALRSLVDDTGPWLVAGIILASVIEPSVVSGILGLPSVLEVLLFAAAGIPVYVCASGATPLAAAFVWAGVSPGAAIAFLMAGPATNVTTFATLTQLHGRKVALAFAAVVLGLSVASGIAFNTLWSGEVPTHVDHDPHGHGILAWVSLGIMALVFADSLVRLGPSQWVSSVLTFGHDDHDGHDHGHSHGHDHHDHHGSHAHAHGGGSHRLMDYRAAKRVASGNTPNIKLGTKTKAAGCSDCDCGH